LGHRKSSRLLRISKAKGACATTKESCAQAGVAADAIKGSPSVAFLPRITPYTRMVTSIPKVDFQPVEMTTGDSGKRLYDTGVRLENLEYDLARSAFDYKDGVFLPTRRFFAVPQD
jgi:hypothetical protein